MGKTIRHWEEIIGNGNIKEIVINAISRDALSGFTLLTGSSGIGKSTFAKMIAKTLLCLDVDKETGQPCDNCKECNDLEAGSSVSYVKINMPQLYKKSDVDKKVEEIFKVQKLSDKTVYILEEVHGLTRELQVILLEELTKIPNNVWIIACTTKPYELLPEILNRAVEFKLQEPSKKECVKYAKGLCNEFGIIVIEDLAINKLIEACDYNPRRISEVVRVVATDNKLSVEALSKMFNPVKNSHMIDLIISITTKEDLYTSITLLRGIQDEVSLNQVTRRLLDVMYTFILAKTGEIDKQSSGIDTEIYDCLDKKLHSADKELMVSVVTYLGSAGLKEYESKSSQLSKIITVKQKMNKILKVLPTTEKESVSNPVVNSIVNKTEEFSKPIQSVSELDSILVEEGFEI